MLDQPWPELHLNNANDTYPEGQHNVPFFPLLAYVVVQFSLAIFLFHWVAPATFAAELKRPLMIPIWALLFGLPLSLFEYLYHRYLLHSAVLPFLRPMHKAHSHHHGLTAVKAPVTPKEPARLVPVDNEYAVEAHSQEEDMMFPIYSLAIFLALFTVTLGLPFKFLFPHQPVMIGLMISVALYYSAYEFWHAVMHLPFEHFWKPAMEKKTVGNTVKFVYSFHLMHHWRPTSNLAVVGLWGYALWDHVFGTHHRPKNTPLVGTQVNYFDADLAKPRWPITAIDQSQPKLYTWSRKIEQTFAKMFLGKPK